MRRHNGAVGGRTGKDWHDERQYHSSEILAFWVRNTDGGHPWLRRNAAEKEYGVA